MTLDLDLALARGDFALQARVQLPSQGVTAFVGPSGAGKSSLLHAIAGLLRPVRGHVRLNGRTLFDAAAGVDVPVHRRALGVVFQDGRLFPHLNVRQNLAYGQRHAPAGDGPGFDDVVALLGLAPLLPRRPHTLSGGERQRVAIGRALLARPRALLMDEPLASLDPARRHELLDYLAALPQRFGLPLLYVTHQLDEVLRLADRVVALEGGRCVAAGAALQVLSDLALQPLFGPEEGAVLAGEVADQLPEWQLTRVRVAGQEVVLPHLAAAPGQRVRLRLRARDVTLQAQALATSAHNQLQGTVRQVVDRDGPFAAVEVALAPGAAPGERLWALVTRRSAAVLGLAPGRPVVAAFKAVAVQSRWTALRGAAEVLQ